jgi:hypothetical protein
VSTLNGGSLENYKEGKTMSLKKSNKHDFSSADIEMAEAFYVCFDRPAFQDNFESEGNLNDLMDALDDTIAAINTGVKKRRDGNLFGIEVKGKAYFKNQYLRDSFSKIVRILSETKKLYKKAKDHGYFFDLSTVGRSGLAFHQDYIFEAIKVAVLIDDLRNKALGIANDVYSHMGKEPFKYIETSFQYKKQVSDSSTIFDILVLKPNIMGIGVNLNELFKLLKKVFKELFKSKKSDET